MVTGSRSSGWIAWTGRGSSTSSLISRPPTAFRKPSLAGTSAKTSRTVLSAPPGMPGIKPGMTERMAVEEIKSDLHQIVPHSLKQNPEQLAEPIEPLGHFHDQDGREGKRRGVPCPSQSGLPR